MSWRITNLKLQLHLSGANELIHSMIFYVFIQTPQIVAMWKKTMSLQCNEKHQRYPDGNVLIIYGRTFSCVKFLQWGDQLSVSVCRRGNGHSFYHPVC